MTVLEGGRVIKMFTSEYQLHKYITDNHITFYSTVYYSSTEIKLIYNIYNMKGGVKTCAKNS